MTSARWRKSSYSGLTSDNCVEVGVWRKASYSGPDGGNCVEVGAAGRAVAVRDSRNPDGPALAFGPAAWRAFTRRVKDGAGPA